jgi:hypothetical protein
MLSDDGPNGPKHVGAIYKRYFNCNILCFNKECICWQKSSELVYNIKIRKFNISVRLNELNVSTL